MKLQGDRGAQSRLGEDGIRPARLRNRGLLLVGLLLCVGVIGSVAMMLRARSDRESDHLSSTRAIHQVSSSGVSESGAAFATHPAGWEGDPVEGDPVERDPAELDPAVRDPVSGQDDHPFPKRIDVPFEFPRDAEWLNTDGAIRFRDLRGKFVIFDFWTYCCINCMHILPVLEKLEEKYPNELVVIGVHSAKFQTEKDAENIKEAILRYNIKHPVINDPEHRLWDSFQVSSWPTLLMFDPQGQAVWMRPGEVEFDEVDLILKKSLPYYRRRRLLDDTPVQFELHAFSQPNTPLLFPGKVLADEGSERLYIADSNHNRIVVTDLGGQLIGIIGSGEVGSQDGAFDRAQFNQPQGMFLAGNQLYVADTENHLLRVVDLEKERVETIAGTGEQGRNAFPGAENLGRNDRVPDRWIGRPKATALNSPWAVWMHEEELYVAMAGPHQIWKMNKGQTGIGPYAGNGREDIVDGPLMPRLPYELGAASFAQPSGLASDGTWLYVADSEGSSIRAVPFDESKNVLTVVGTSGLAFNRLFSFGDNDGPRDQVKLQHPLGVVYLEGQLYIADTYNNKIKRISLPDGATTTIAGTGAAGQSDSEPSFDEPAGLSYAKGKLYVADTNNHLIRTVDLASGNVATLTIDGLTPPEFVERPERRGPEKLERGRVTSKPVMSQEGSLKLDVSIELPLGWKMNPNAPMTYRVLDDSTGGLVKDSDLSDEVTRLDQPTKDFSIDVPLTSDSGSDRIRVEVTFYYCQEEGEGLCRVSGVAWDVKVDIDPDAKESALPLTYSVPAD